MKIGLDLKDRTIGRLGRLIVACHDIREAHAFVQQVVGKVRLSNNALFAPLSYAAIISYCRPFTGSKGYPRLSRSYESFERADLAALHDEIRHLRDKCVAHSDEEMTKVVLLLDEPAKMGQLPRDAIRSRCLSLRAFPLFKDLCEHQLARLDQEKDRLKKYLFT